MFFFVFYSFTSIYYVIFFPFKQITETVLQVLFQMLPIFILMSNPYPDEEEILAIQVKTIFLPTGNNNLDVCTLALHQGSSESSLSLGKVIILATARPLSGQALTRS